MTVSELIDDPDFLREEAFEIVSSWRVNYGGLYLQNEPESS